MAVDACSEEGRIIRQFIPLSTIPSKWFAELCQQLAVEEAEDGQFLFKRGDADPDLYFLIRGAVLLHIDGLKIETIHAGSDSARFSLAHQIPRKVNVVAKGKIQYLRLQSDMMRFVPDIKNEDIGSDMIDIESTDNNDWMTTLLMSPIFRMLPPANLQKVLMSVREVSYKAGDKIFSQGEEGDYFYIIKKGQCIITRRPSANAKEVKLATFSEQDVFGEDALISGEPRNKSVSALTDVYLLRLDKNQFLTLIKEPVLKYISYPDATDLQAKGGILIDVREPEEFKKYHLPRSVNIPLFSLRMHLRTMNRQHPVILVCKNGATSETAAFLFIRHKFNAFVLLGGIDKLSADLLNPSSDSVAQTEIPEPSNIKPVSEDTELEHLRRYLHKLKIQYTALFAEKKALEEKCAMLAEQVNKLTAQLISNKKRGE
ncbi:MAG: cyclic nucleotide-binding domain-containing protein [Methylomonas sp.]|jgi:CRP-like cAMP-binding protein